MTAPRGKCKAYTKEQLVEAVSKIECGELTLYGAMKKYEIPRRTLRDHVSGKVSNFGISGAKRVLSFEEEEALVKYIDYMSSHNFPLRRHDLRAVIVEMIKRSGPERIAQCRFNLANGPSDFWFRSFLKRHPQVKCNIPEGIDSCRSMQSTEFVFDHFFTLYECMLHKYDLLDKPSQIYNCDETGISGNRTGRQKAFGIVGQPLYQNKVTSIDHITSMMCCSASGQVMPNFLIFQKSLPEVGIEEQIPDSWIFAKSPNGYMDKELFATWFRQIFLKHMVPQRPVLLLMDNHVSHFSKEVLDLAEQNQVQIIGFPAHTTHILQPLDVGVFGPLKQKYHALCVSIGQQSARAKVTRKYFPTVWKNAIQQAVTPNVVKSAFRRSGCYPFDPCAIDNSKIKTQRIAKKPIASSQVISVSPLKDITETSSPTSSTHEIVHAANVDILENNTDIGDKCEKCGRYGVPIPEVLALPPEIQSAFHILPSVSNKDDKAASSSVTTVKSKRKRMNCSVARFVTGADVKQQIIEQEERNELLKKKIPKSSNITTTCATSATTLTSSKKKSRKIINVPSKHCTRSSSSSQSISPKPCHTITNKKAHVTNVESSQVSTSQSSVVQPSAQQDAENDINQDICYCCMQEVPPVKKCTRKRKSNNIDWVECSTCLRWYHCQCLKLKLNQLKDDFFCDLCQHV